MSSQHEEITPSVLKSLGLTSDQIFQLLMAKEKTLQKQEERKIKELEFNSAGSHLINGNQTNDKKRAQEGATDFTSLSKKQKRIVYPNILDLCTDEIFIIFGYLPNFSAFCLGFVSKSFYEVIERIKNVYLVQWIKPSSIVQFMKSTYFDRIESLVIDFQVTHSAAVAILSYCRSNNLRKLHLSIDKNSDGTLQFSSFKDSCFNCLQTLHISCGVDYNIKLDNSQLYNLKNLWMEGAVNLVHEYLNSRVNNIQTLCLQNVDCHSPEPIKMLMLNHLALIDCGLSEQTFSDFLKNSSCLEVVELSNISLLVEEEDDEEEEEEKEEIECNSLRTIIEDGIPDDLQIILFESALPSLEILTIACLDKPCACYLSENTSIKSLKKLTVTNSTESGALSLLVNSTSFFQNIETLIFNIPEYLDSQSLLDISKISFQNLKKLVLLTETSCMMEGYKSFFECENFKNITYLSITAPEEVDDLMYLANTKCLPNLKHLMVKDTDFCYGAPKKFFSCFADNSNFRKLEELKLTFISDESIDYLRDSSHLEKLHTVWVSEEVITARGFKLLDEWEDISWSTFEEHEEHNEDEEHEEEVEEVEEEDSEEDDGDEEQVEAQ